MGRANGKPIVAFSNLKSTAYIQAGPKDLSVKETGLARNHNCGLVRDEYGHLNNPKEIEGVRVYEIYELSLKYPDALVILAIRNQYKEHVRSLLKENGFNRIMDVDLDSCIDILKRQWIKICNPNEEFLPSLNRIEDLPLALPKMHRNIFFASLASSANPAQFPKTYTPAVCAPLYIL